MSAKLPAGWKVKSKLWHKEYGTCVRRTHNFLKLTYQALMCLRHCLMVHKPHGLWCFVVFCGVCMLATSVKGGVLPHGHLGTRHEHADIQANAELTGSSSRIFIPHVRATAVVPSTSRALLVRTDRP